MKVQEITMTKKCKKEGIISRFAKICKKGAWDGTCAPFTTGWLRGGKLEKG